MTKIIIAGGRDFSDYDLLTRAIDLVLMREHFEYKDVEIVSGRAKGADTLGERYAMEHGIQVSLWPADWKKHGKAAGFIRNHKMGDYADFLVAFWDRQSHGTKDMIDYMRGLGKQTQIFYYSGPRAAEVREKEFKKFWGDQNPDPWKDPSDIPDIPAVKDLGTWENLVVPGIIKRGGLPKATLIPWHIYSGSCRNASEALWTGKTFRYTRYKWGTSYTDTTPHFEDEALSDMFIPLVDLGEANENDSRRI